MDRSDLDARQLAMWDSFVDCAQKTEHPVTVQWFLVGLFGKKGVDKRGTV